MSEGRYIRIRGEAHRIVRTGKLRGLTEISEIDGEKVLLVGGAEDHLARRIRDFLKLEARKDLEVLARGHAARIGRRIASVSMKDTKSRWGSCSNTGVLSFSWRLILAPPFVLDYLAAHEVSHLVELNHSLRFWRLVKRLYPDVEQAKAWLDVNGTDLHRYGLSGRRRPGDL